MPEAATTVGEVAAVRTKNAGPFWVTIDVFANDDNGYRQLAAGRALTAEAVGALYQVPAGSILVFWLPDLLAVKISFPRASPQGTLEDRDMHAGQQHVPLLLAPITTPASDDPGARA